MTNNTYPQSGRMMYRTVENAMAVVGVVRLPDEFIPVEGSVYILTKGQGVVSIANTPVSQDTPDHLALNNVDGQLANKIWPTPLAEEDIPVRFMSAFPNENIWTVYGASPHQFKDVEDNKWEDIQDGRTKVVPFPAETAGMTMGQILTERAAWPGPDGQLYSVPQTTTKWREKFLRYHRILAEGARTNLSTREITAKVKFDPQLSGLVERPVDPAYCRFLNELERMGANMEDRPATQPELVKRQQMAQVALVNSLNSRSGARKPGR